MVDVMICVNNPDNGNYCGRCAGVSISDFIDLDPRVLPEPRCTLAEEYFSIHRRRFEVRAHQTWVGNWCWDSIRLADVHAAELVALLLSRKSGEHDLWGIECAHGERVIDLADRRDKGMAIHREDVLSAMYASKVA